MPTSFYRLIGRHADHTQWEAGPHTGGPWSAGLQHGGPPNALAVATAEALVARETGRDDLIALRLAADFVRPVPLGALEVRARLLRAARSAALVEVGVSAAGRDCLLVRVWFVRDADTSALAPSDRPDSVVPDAGPLLDLDFAYGNALEWRLTRGGMRTAGPGAAWVRPHTRLFDGYAYSGLARAVLIADSASGLGSELEWGRWSFVNVDLDVHLARPFVGDWLLMESSTQLGSHGSALARSTLSDVRGVVGAGLQTLVLAAVPAAPSGPPS